MLILHVVPLNTGIVRPHVDAVRDIGSSALQYRDIYASSTVNCTEIEVSDITAPSSPGAGRGVVYKKTGDDGLFYKSEASATEKDLTNPGYLASAKNKVECTLTTYNIIPDMSITPGAGRHMALFSGNFTHEEKNSYGDFATFNNDTEITNSHRYAWLEKEPFNTPLSTQTKTVVADGQANS